MDNKPIENVDIIGEEEAERIASELKANSQAYEGEEIVNTLDKDYPTSIEDAVEQIEKLQCRIEGLEEVIRHNKNSYLRMKREYHREAYYRHLENIERLDKDIGYEE